MVTYTIPQEWGKDGSAFVFVIEGVESAVEQEKATAGDKVVSVNSASIAQHCIKARRLDELLANQVPVLLGGGVQSFENLGNRPIELEQLGLVEGDGVSHLRFRIVKAPG